MFVSHFITYTTSQHTFVYVQFDTVRMKLLRKTRNSFIAPKRTRFKSQIMRINLAWIFEFYVEFKYDLWCMAFHSLSSIGIYKTECNHWIYTIYKKYYFQGRFSLTRHILVICHTWECFIDRRTAHLTNIVFWFSVSTPFYNLWFSTSQYFSLVELWLFLCSSLYSRKLFQPQISCKWHAIYIYT